MIDGSYVKKLCDSLKCVLIGTGTAMNAQCAGCEIAFAQQIGRQCWPNVQKTLFAERIRAIIGVPLEFRVLE